MNNFDKNWGNAKKSIFRLEGRPEYRVPGEQGNIEKWKKGELDMSGNKEWQKWMESLKNAQAKGLVVSRVRVVPKIMNDYTRCEIDMWQEYSAKNGEEFFFMNENEYQTIIAEFGFNTKDFWLFDDEKLLIFNYNKTGQFAGDILIADGGMVKRYADLKIKLLQKSTPLATFVKKLGK